MYWEFLHFISRNSEIPMLACVLTTKSPKNKVNKFNSELEAPPPKKKHMIHMVDGNILHHV